MYWRGHVGIALLAYAPIAAVVRAAGEPELAVLGAAVAVAFATLPDADHWFPIPHRGPTHTVAFAVGVAIAVATTTAAVLTVFAGGVTVDGPMAGGVTPLFPVIPLFVGGVAFTSVCSHLAGDAITPMGIRPLRPVSEAHVTLNLTPAKDPWANRLFFGVGVVALALALGVSTGTPV
ncbi:metal-dependent hydrolase [Halorubrum sp. DTA46]|uniref:metal-dependent hydrolase n=1 Tax=Halorubrum sp. DTA46 TaxID=3402162 RepID=UPI003AAD4BE8